jgi:hypothetical protein
MMKKVISFLGPSEGTSNFLKYEEDYGMYEDSEGELPDEDIIEPNLTE